MSRKMIFTKNSSSRYLRLRSGQSSQVQIRKVRPNRRRPSFQTASERVPTGQSQAQKLLRASRLMATKVSSKTRAAGCTRSIVPVTSQDFKPTSAPMGRNPSTPGGRATNTVAPAVS